MNDYSALAQRVSMSISGVRGCLMLSRDGMVLGAHPEGEAETHIRSSWVRFAAVGDPERSYVEYPDQVWAFVRRGSYSAFAVADAGVRPGVLVDLLDQALMVGEQDRVRDRETMRVPEAPSAPSGKPRISMHKPERSTPSPSIPSEVTSRAADVPAPERNPAEVPVSAEAEPIAADPGAQVGNQTPQPEEDVPVRAQDEVPARAQEEAPARAQEEERAERPERAEKREDESEVDRILLAKEFAGLLQVPKEDDEASR
jgi:hypothetical protein